MSTTPQAKIDKLRELFAAGKSLNYSAQMAGVSNKTAIKYREMMGFKPLVVYGRDYTEMDALIRAKATTKEICERLGVQDWCVRARRSKIVLEDTSMEPEFILPVDRLKLALEAKADALGMPLSWITGTWLKGQAGKEWLRTYEDMPGVVV